MGHELEQDVLLLSTRKPPRISVPPPAMKPTLALALTLAASASAAHLPRQSPAGAAAVDLSSTRGPAQSLASGFLYGFPDNGTSPSTHIPPSLVTPLKLPASRGGGSQLPAPDLGWAVGGYDSYVARFESALSNYRTTRMYGGDFILLVSDLWGSDGVDDSGGYYPGDGGDWEDVEAFWAQLLKDISENDMVEGLVFDVWNEPDIEQFWNRTWDQYLELYVRSHNFVRSVPLPTNLSYFFLFLSDPSTKQTPGIISRSSRSAGRPSPTRPPSTTPTGPPGSPPSQRTTSYRTSTRGTTSAARRPTPPPPTSPPSSRLTACLSAPST